MIGKKTIVTVLGVVVCVYWGGGGVNCKEEIDREGTDTRVAVGSGGEYGRGWLIPREGYVQINLEETIGRYVKREWGEGNE